MSDDKAQIMKHGGPTKVAELLGFTKHGGVQRVQNWMTRGIPPKVKLARPDLFPSPMAPDPARPHAPAPP